MHRWLLLALAWGWCRHCTGRQQRQRKTTLNKQCCALLVQCGRSECHTTHAYATYTHVHKSTRAHRYTPAVNLFMQQGSDVPATRISSRKFVDRHRLTTDIAMSDPSASIKACLAKADGSRNNSKPRQVLPYSTRPSAIRVVNLDIEYPNAKVYRAEKLHRSRQAPTLVDLRGSGCEQLRTGTGRADRPGRSDFEADESANAFQ